MAFKAHWLAKAAVTAGGETLTPRSDDASLMLMTGCTWRAQVEAIITTLRSDIGKDDKLNKAIYA